MDPERRPVGLLTDRDLVVRALAAGLDPPHAPAGEVLTREPRSVHEATPIEEAVAIVRRLEVRRLPVVDAEERLVGILGMDDVLGLLGEELSGLGRIVARPIPPPKAVTPATSDVER